MIDWVEWDECIAVSDVRGKKVRKYVERCWSGKMKTKEEYDIHVCLWLQQSPALAIVQDSRLTMKIIQKRGSDKELRRWNGRDKAWIKERGRRARG